MASRDRDETLRGPALGVAMERWAATQPDAPFLVEAEMGRTLTYGECLHAVQMLRRRLGAQPRTIALALPGGVPAALVWLAALTGGHRLLPCAPEATASERAQLGRTQRPDTLVVETQVEAEGFACPQAAVITSDWLYGLALGSAGMSDGCDCLLTDRNGGPTTDKLAPTRDGTVRLTTSGTTGEPKGVILSAQQIAWTADSVRASHHLTPADRGLCVLPFFHINAPVVSLCASLLAGATVVIAPRFSRRHFWEWIAEERITWASIVPTIVALLLTTERPAVSEETLRFVRTASAPLPLAHHLAFEERFGVPVVETYGLSEAGSQVTANPVPPGKRRPGSVGLPTGAELRICSPAHDGDGGMLRTVAPGMEGEVCVRGPNVITSYEEGAGASAFCDGWFRTGDLGYRDADGYLFLTGRLRDVINRGGEKVSPREIEEALLGHPMVRDAAVIGEPHPIYGQRVVAYVALHVGGRWDGETEEALRSYCAERLSAYKVPERFHAVDELPRNGNGKLARWRLPSARIAQHAEQQLDRQGVLAHG